MLIENSAAESRHPYDRLLAQKVDQAGLTTTGTGTYTVLSIPITPDVRSVVTGLRITVTPVTRLSELVTCEYRLEQGALTVYTQTYTHNTYSTLSLIHDQPIILASSSNLLLKVYQYTGATTLSVNGCTMIDEYMPG